MSALGDYIRYLENTNDLLLELVKEQIKTMQFVNKIAYDTTKYQRSLPKENQNVELLDFAWSTNDCLVDNPRQREIIEILKEKDINIIEDQSNENKNKQTM